MALPATEKKSRLLTNSVNIRSDLESRNLYAPENEYPLDPTTTTKIVNTISAIGSTLSPFRSQDLRNSAIGRLIVDKSPITEIGLQCLGTQLAYNTASRLNKEYIPTISIGNLFDKDSSTNLFTWKKDYSLTKNIYGSNKGIIGGVEKVLNIAEGIYPNKSPFQKDVSNDELIKNTGKAIIAIRDSNLKRNLYLSDYKKTSLNFFSIDQRNNKNYRFFDSTYNKFFTNNEISNKNMAESYNLFAGTIFEYGSVDYKDYFIGKTSKNIKVYNVSEALFDSNPYKLSTVLDTNMNTWLYNSENINLHWDYLSPNNSYSYFNNQGGLVEYTRNLMIASKGKYVANNYKVYRHDDNTLGFNGSGIFEAPSTALPEFAKKVGLRQHTFKDPYDNFSKAIRFVGNKNYNDNKDSVIYESVLPRMHPVPNSTDADNNKKLMFSIENLAFQVIAEEGKKGIIINSGSSNEIIPISEVGAFGGRVMWFPPYDLGIVETADAKFTPTVFLGRNEPIYNYENSERSATITFKLLADYPQNLHDFAGKSSKEIAEFFSFGGKVNEKSKKEIFNNTESDSPQIYPLSNETLYIFFQNDEPKEEKINNIIYDISASGYGITDNNGTVNKSALKSLYYYSDTPLVYGEKDLNDPLNKLLYDPNSDIIIDLIGHTTALYYNTPSEKEYNQKLSDRRVRAVKYLIEERFKALGLTNFTFGIQKGFGSDNAPKETGYPTSNITDEELNKIINSDLSVSWRCVDIIIKKYKKNNTFIPISILAPDLSTKSINQPSLYEKTFLKDRSNVISNNIEGIDSNYESIKDNYFMPVFHSQTPEDYHRRLTFLQQCTRQGAAQRTEQGGNNIRNSVFGRQPICILRIGDFMYTKIIINSINFSYKDAMWDLNPEGFGLQPLMCDVTMNIKIIGGQSLKGPIDLLQNAISFNYYANSTYTDKGIYKIPKSVEDNQFSQDRLNKTAEENKKILDNYKAYIDSITPQQKTK